MSEILLVIPCIIALAAVDFLLWRNRRRAHQSVEEHPTIVRLRGRLAEMRTARLAFRRGELSEEEYLRIVDDE